MQTTQDLLKLAIAAARGGREWTARDMFLQVVSLDPRNELAWMWLTGLLEDVDDQIYACEQVLQINPQNRAAARHLARLHAEKQKQRDEENRRAEEQLQAAREAWKAGKKESALAELRALAANPQAAHPDLWRMLAELSPEWEERAQALERLTELYPQDEETRKKWERARYYARHPIHQAELYEESGEIDKAIKLYLSIAAEAGSKSAEWNKILRKVNELEDLKREGVVHIPPALEIARLTAGPPMVYFMFALIHVGINPFANPDFLTWSGLLWVILGSFFVALASTPSHNRFWELLFQDVSGKGSPAARSALALAGWILVALPHLLMFAAAFYRLANFTLQIP